MKNIFVAGHHGMVGSAICRTLESAGDTRLITRDRSQLDLQDQQAVRSFFQREKIDQVYLAAAMVGGIHANDTYPADFIYRNLEIQNNVIYMAFESGIRKLLFLGSSCIYPRLADQPMEESALLTGALEPTNEPYAIAKIAGIKLCESLNRQHGVDYRSVMPTNLYGINDNFHPENSHVIPALMRRFHEARLAGDAEVVVWGSGNVCREFLYVDDMAEASVFVMNLPKRDLDKVVQPSLSHLNIGTGKDVTIRQLAQSMKQATGFGGELVFDSSKPDGAPRKLLDVARMTQLGWRYRVELDQGLALTYDWFCSNIMSIRE
ncbi:MAG: GDP-L-fucose synthase [Gammaproteobacteria bacterium]|nr:GDP-L-fucose synthase [Gammaproteobacteria bacterium]